jgi:hypothetical protein
MIRLALFDLGESLIHDGVPFPHAMDALRVIARFKTEGGELLVLGLVSDFLPAEPPGTEDKIAAREAEYAKVLEGAGLVDFFKPFSARVTLSTRAGVNKPDRRIFELAAERSGTGATLSECLFVTEDIDHLARCAGFGIQPVRFGIGPGIKPAFSDWADAPAVIASLVHPGGPHNQVAATEAALAGRYHLFGFRPTGTGGAGAGQVKGQANQLVKLDDPKLGALDGVYVELPGDVTVSLGADNRVSGVVATPPGTDEVADAVNYVTGLVKNGQVAMPGQPTSGTTHAVEQDADGQKRLVRRGYSAV